MNLFLALKKFLITKLKPNHLIETVSNVSENSKILDVGCGSKSPVRLKMFFPSIELYGIDVTPISVEAMQALDYFQISSSKGFHYDILGFETTFDLIISHHNLEHCTNKEGVLTSMASKLKKNGILFLCFPSKRSLILPSRKGTLNYFDDLTHTEFPPNFESLQEFLKLNQFEIMHMRQYYQPPIMRIIGGILEPLSKILGVVLIGTWSFHGFESLIVAKKTR